MKVMFSKVMLDTELAEGELPHDLILIPFKVSEMVLSLTMSPVTSFSSGYFPKLPTLLFISNKLTNYRPNNNNNYNKHAFSQ